MRRRGRTAASPPAMPPDSVGCGLLTAGPGQDVPADASELRLRDRVSHRQFTEDRKQPGHTHTLRSEHWVHGDDGVACCVGCVRACLVALVYVPRAWLPRDTR